MQKSLFKSVKIISVLNVAFSKSVLVLIKNGCNAVISVQSLNTHSGFQSIFKLDSSKENSSQFINFELLRVKIACVTIKIGHLTFNRGSIIFSSHCVIKKSLILKELIFTQIFDTENINFALQSDFKKSVNELNRDVGENPMGFSAFIIKNISV